MTNVLVILSCVFFSAGLCLSSRRIFHFLQLESYQLHGFLKTMFRQWRKVLLTVLPPAVCAAAVSLLLAEKNLTSSRDGTIRLILSVLLFDFGLFIHARYRRLPEKKPFRITPRVKRLYGTLFALSFVLTFFTKGCLLFSGMNLALLWALLPLLVIFARIISTPIERLIYEMYFRDARKKLLKNDRLIRIGITGSYGKTSVKLILGTILSQKYQVLSTPGSVNVPMGLSVVIRDQLEPTHQIFLAEMGARHKKDIRELCRLVRPTVGILTSVGPQHLETFKTLENIQNTKYDLIRALPEDGLAAFCDDGGIVKNLYLKTDIPKILTGQPGDDAWAENIQLSAGGSSFLLHLGEETLPCTTSLLGAHNIQNIVLAAAVARKLNVSTAQIKRGIERLQAPEHRLQLIQHPNQITVIDDAFNSNPQSSRYALEVLNQFEGRHIVITPGMVELGAKEESYNYEFGKVLSESADIILLIGAKHTRPIYQALSESRFYMENVIVKNSLKDAVDTLNTFLQPGDVVLYENDLPDHYSET